MDQLYKILQRTINQFRKPNAVEANTATADAPISLDMLNEDAAEASAVASTSSIVKVEQAHTAKKKIASKQKIKLKTAIEEVFKIKPFIDCSSVSSLHKKPGEQITMTEILSCIKKERAEQDISIDRLRRPSLQSTATMNGELNQMTLEGDNETRGELNFFFKGPYHMRARI
jgi:hypothetical protein